MKLDRLNGGCEAAQSPYSVTLNLFQGPV